MALINTPDLNAIQENSRGGGKLFLWEMNPSSFSITGDAVNLGEIKDIDYTLDFGDVKKTNEAGLPVKYCVGEADINFKATLQQSDKATQDLCQETPNKIYGLYHHNGLYGTKAQEIFFGIGSVKATTNLKSPGKEIAFEYRGVNNNSAIVLSLTGASSLTALGSSVTSVTIPPNGFYFISEA